ncbi:MAG: FHA domain-containing protein, partial [Deltaproteobacteria bacterium]|nr:FHA domain-containing protein [Deltaproteobacteria bacterium]
MGAALSVQVMRGGQLVSQHHFDSDTHRTIKIGRLPSAQLKIEDASVARIHAVIEFAGGDVSLIDMGSTVGTAVNGAKVHKVKLGHGDQVAIGDTQLVIGLGGAAQAMPQMAAAPAQAAMAAPAAWGGAPQAAAQAWAQPAAPPTPQPMPSPGRAPSQPRFDPGNTQVSPMRRITKERLRTAAVESRPHPALPPEEAMTPDNRVLEMRLYWGEVLLGMNHYFRPKQITIGETKKTDVFISSEGLPTERFPLIRFLGGQYVLAFTQQMDGELVPLANLRGSNRVRRDPEMAGTHLVALPPAGRAVIHWGGATF